MNIEYIKGQTLIDEDEKEGLLISTITTKSELDEFEQLNIEEAIQWAIGRKFKAKDIFLEKFICNLHKRMYGNIWSWAGKFRKTDKNIGVDKYQIPIKLKILCDDAYYWTQNQIYPPDEIAIRFKHGIVSIHCFPNGNGRHSRLMGDLINEKLFGHAAFTWGARDLSQAGHIRSAYLQAVRAADQATTPPYWLLPDPE